MKKHLTVLAVLMVAGSLAWADGIALYDGLVATNGAVVTTNTVSVGKREVRGVWLSFTGTANPTVDVDIVTDTTGNAAVAQTILSKDDISADVYIPMLIQSATTAGVAISGEYTFIRLDGANVKCWLSEANTTGITVRVVLDVEKP